MHSLISNSYMKLYTVPSNTGGSLLRGSKWEVTYVLISDVKQSSTEVMLENQYMYNILTMSKVRM